MDEITRAARFAAELDHLLENGAPPPDASEGELLATAARFVAADFSVEAQRRNHPTLRARRQPRWVRTLATIAAAITLLVALTLAIPPLRTLAQDVLARIGAFVFTDAPSIAEEMEGEPFATPSYEMVIGEMSIEAASEHLGFSVLEPAYLPEGYKVTQRDVNESERVSGASTYFTSQAVRRIPDFFSLNQQRWTVEQPVTWAMGDAEVQAVVVRGVEGIYIPDAPVGLNPDADGNAEVFTMNMLVWEENSFTFTLQATLLELDELLLIADSLQ